MIERREVVLTSQKVVGSDRKVHLRVKGTKDAVQGQEILLRLSIARNIHY